MWLSWHIWNITCDSVEQLCPPLNRAGVLAEILKFVSLFLKTVAVVFPNNSSSSLKNSVMFTGKNETTAKSVQKNKPERFAEKTPHENNR